MKGYVQTDEGQIHYVEEGIGDPVILIHAAPSSSAMWEELLPRLASLGRHPIAFDLPGYGMSDPPISPPSLEDYARRVLDAARELGLERFDAIGHHFGASVVLTAAAEHPERFRRVVLYGIALLEEGRAKELRDEGPPDFEETGADLISWWKQFWTIAGPTLGPIVAPRCMADLMLSREGRPYGYNAVGRADHERLLRALTVPTLAIAGDREMLRRETETAAARSPWITFREIANAGVFVADEKPDELAKIIHDFLSEH